MNSTKSNTRVTKGKPGFTLIELLVCIVTISVLAALLFPFAKSGVASSKQAKCAQNLRSQASAALMFAADNSGRLPYGGWFEGGQNLADGDPRIWYNSIFPYLGNSRKVFECPAGKDHKADTWLIFSDKEKFPSHYGYNICLNWPDQPLQIATAAGGQKLAGVPMIMDVNYQAFMPYWDFDDQSLSPQAGTALAARHNNRGNIVWLDGHVSSESFKDFYDRAKKAGGGKEFLSGNY